MLTCTLNSFALFFGLSMFALALSVALHQQDMKMALRGGLGFVAAIMMTWVVIITMAYFQVPNTVAIVVTMVAGNAMMLYASNRAMNLASE
jgi:hypothetical protein